MYRPLRNVDDIWPNYPALYPTRHLSKFSKLLDSRTYIFRRKRYLTKVHWLPFSSNLNAFLSLIYIFPAEIFPLPS
jgi:hypothetical protein